VPRSQNYFRPLRQADRVCHVAMPWAIGKRDFPAVLADGLQAAMLFATRASEKYRQPQHELQH